jgi:hypothetical protein
MGEGVSRLIVLIRATEVGHGNYMHDAGNGANLVAIVNGKEVGERDLVTRHDAKGGIRGPLVDVKGAPDAEHDAEQEERKRDAGHRQQTAALVAKGGLGDEMREGHGFRNILHGNFLSL